MLKIVRFNNWWSIIIPQVLGWIYFCELTAEHSVLIYDWKKVLLFLIGVLSISSFGHLLNDYFDINTDSISGKSNSLARFNSLERIVIVILPLIIGIASWAILKAGVSAKMLYAFQILTLIFYSAPPIRLKERSSLGIIADAFYGHINPAFFTIFTFVDWSQEHKWFKIIFLIALFICTSLKGVRNILLHQINDRKKDLKATLNTFVVNNGALFSLNFINNLLPYESLFTFMLVLIISIKIPPFFLSALIFAFITYLKFSGWKLSYLPERQIKFKFLFFQNDFYEGWMPVFFLLILSIHQTEFLFLLTLHLLFFPSFVIKLWSDLKTIRENFATEDDY